MCYHIFEVLLPYEFLLEQNDDTTYNTSNYVLLPYEFLLEQNCGMPEQMLNSVLLPYEFLLEQNMEVLYIVNLIGFVTI